MNSREEILRGMLQDKEGLEEDLLVELKHRGPGMERVFKMECALAKVLDIMTTNGLLFDLKIYEANKAEVYKTWQDLEKQLFNEVGRPFNIRKRADLEEILFNQMKLPRPDIKTGKGAQSLNEEALSHLYSQSEFVKRLTEARHYANIFGSHQDVERNLTYENGLVYLKPTFKQVGEDGTARIFTTEPSVNTLPIPYRKAVVPRPGHKFFYLDWSGAELVYMAYMAGQDDLVEAYLKGIDLHKYVSSKVLSIPFDQITSELREVSKVITFSVAFGSVGGAASRKMKVSFEEAHGWFNSFMLSFPKIKKYMDGNIKFARDKGYIQTWIGRQRILHNVKSLDKKLREKDERRALNNPIQFGVADLLKWAMCRIHSNHSELSLKFTVFDSFLLEVPNMEDKDKWANILQQDFIFNHKGLEIKFLFKIKEGYDWGSLQED